LGDPVYLGSKFPGLLPALNIFKPFNPHGVIILENWTTRNRKTATGGCRVFD
jgi:hypothetical protein